MDGSSRVTELVHQSVRLTPGPRALHQQLLLHLDSEGLVPRSWGCPAGPAPTEEVQGEGGAGWGREVVSGRVLGCDSLRDGAEALAPEVPALPAGVLGVGGGARLLSRGWGAGAPRSGAVPLEQLSPAPEGLGAKEHLSLFPQLPGGRRPAT